MVTVELPSVSERNDDDSRRVNWKWVVAWTAFGVGLLCLAAVMEGLDKWAGVSIDILVHIGATLLLAPLLPFLERSLTRSVVGRVGGGNLTPRRSQNRT